MKRLVSKKDAGLRLDTFLRTNDPQHSRSFFKKLIDQDCVLVSGKPGRTKTVLKEGDTVVYTLPAPEVLTLQAEDIPLKIIHEDATLLVVDKPSGLVVHPAAGHLQGTLVHALLNHMKNLSSIGGVERPGIVHRLDKDTSGLILIAKTDAAHTSLSKQFANRTVKKEYLCLVAGLFKKKEGTIASVLGRHPANRKIMSSTTSRGREAVTVYKVEKEFTNTSLVRCYPQTGRTHQIRVHMKEAGHPIVGDPLYGGKKGQDGHRLFLHAAKISFTHPGTGKTVSFESPLPEDLNERLK